MTTPQFTLTLVDTNPAVCEAWIRHFPPLPPVYVANASFETLEPFSCMVSPANSFGLMDGGIDAAITRFYGTQLMERVQQRIISDWRGEQPVGTSFIIETGDYQYPFLAHTPTMRVPMTIAGTDAVYRAMWAMLLEVDRHNRYGATPITSVVCPGLGTATGRVPPDEAARQMALAWRNFLNPPQRISWPYAMAKQHAANGSREALAELRRLGHEWGAAPRVERG